MFDGNARMHDQRDFVNLFTRKSINSSLAFLCFQNVAKLWYWPSRLVKSTIFVKPLSSTSTNKF